MRLSAPDHLLSAVWAGKSHPEIKRQEETPFVAKVPITGSCPLRVCISTQQDIRTVRPFYINTNYVSRMLLWITFYFGREVTSRRDAVK